MFSHQEALSNITLVALREQPHTGIYVQVGLAYNRRFNKWIEVTDKETVSIQSFPGNGYIAIRPAANLTAAGAPFTEELGLATCPGCSANKSSWCPDTLTACFCHPCTVAQCEDLNHSQNYGF